MIRALIGLAVLYGTVAVITFGHGAARAEQKYRADHAACLARHDPHEVCWESDVPAANGLAAALLWPLYWSWEAWS